MLKKASRTRPPRSRWTCLAVEADDIVKVIKEQARERQIRKPADFVTQQIGEQKESAEIIADMFNTNKQYIREAEKLF